MPVVVTTLEQLTQHGANAAVWRRLGRTGEQTLTAALDNPDGHALYRAQEARADVADQQRRAAQREAQRPVCERCGEKFTDQRWAETTTPGYAWEAGSPAMCRNCDADYRADREAAEAVHVQAAAPEPEDGPEPGRGLEDREPRRRGLVLMVADAGQLLAVRVGVVLLGAHLVPPLSDRARWATRSDRVRAPAPASRWPGSA
ncbi:hypothetical protein ACF05T_26985 [Streptomyces lateritius]|uniref:HNH endonuclease n=1 Tax=Streptomyces lateritius TaxID=67313 RepID=A0ABW6YIN5_9ACTN